MQPHTPEGLCSTAPDQTTTCAGAFLPSCAQGETGQLVPNEQCEETREGSLTAEGPQAAEEEAALSWARGLLPEEEEGLPLATVLWLTLYLTPNAGRTAQLHNQEGPLTGSTLPGSSEAAMQSGFQSAGAQERDQTR